MIRINALNAGYGNDIILKDINATFTQKAVTVIIGPNGSGKSTLLKCLARQLTPQSGEIRLDDTPLETIPRKEYAKRVSYLKQSRDTPMLTVQNLVLHGRFPYMGFPRRVTETDIKIAKEAMERAGVWALHDKQLNALSGGERQRAYLAMALAQNSDILLLDEPSTFLDIRHQLELMGLLRTLCNDGKTILVVLHDINAALNIADNICLMNGGKIEFFGKPKDLLKTDALSDVFGVTVQNVTHLNRQGKEVTSVVFEI